MKFLKRIFCLMMVLVIMVSAVVFPVSATEEYTILDKLSDEISNFPVLRRNSGNAEYVKLLQRFLYVYPGTHELVYNTDNTYHGIDGGFGWVTEEAVLIFQTAYFGQSGADGIVGTNTWNAMRSYLVTFPGDLPGDVLLIYDYYTIADDVSVMMYPAPSNNRYSLYTFRANNSRFPNPFHSFTYPS